MNQLITALNPIFGLLGWSVYGLLMLLLVSVIISAAFDRIVRSYYEAKLTYATLLPGASSKQNPQTDRLVNFFEFVKSKATE